MDVGTHHKSIAVPHSQSITPSSTKLATGAVFTQWAQTENIVLHPHHRRAANHDLAFESTMTTEWDATLSKGDSTSAKGQLGPASTKRSKRPLAIQFPEISSN